MAEGISVQEIRAFFNDSEKPLGLAEFKDYWGSLTDSEKNEVREYVASLSK